MIERGVAVLIGFQQRLGREPPRASVGDGPKLLEQLGDVGKRVKRHGTQVGGQRVVGAPVVKLHLEQRVPRDHVRRAPLRLGMRRGQHNGRAVAVPALLVQRQHIVAGLATKKKGVRAHACTQSISKEKKKK